MARTRRSFGNIRKRPGSTNFYVRFTFGTDIVERVAGPNRTIADRKLAQAQTLLAENATLERILEEVFGEKQEARSCPTLCEAIPTYLAAMRGRLKVSTLEGYGRLFNALARLPWAKHRLDEIDHGTLKAWRAGRQGKVSSSTLNRNLSALSALFTWAMEEDLIVANPARRVRKLSERGRARETYLSEGEARGLVEAAVPGFRPFLIAALATGMRRSEIMKMTWASVDLERRTLTVEPENAKSGRARTIALSEWLLETLLPLSPKLGDPRASVHPFGMPGGKRYQEWDVRREFQRALAACPSIPEEKKKTVVLHTLRHTAASLMVAGGVPIFDVAKILGHSTLQVTMRYAHFAPEAGRAAIDALDRQLRPPAATPPDRVAEDVLPYEPAAEPLDAPPRLRILPGGSPRLVIRPRGSLAMGQSMGHTPLPGEPD